MVNNEAKIKIIKDGPYLVSGNVPLKEKIIVEVGNHYEYHPGRELPQSESYSLCRCGQSKNPPFCDGSHQEVDFDGTEIAEKGSYRERAEHIEGEEIDLLDDHRCALARFCHTEKGSTWEMVKESSDQEKKKEAIKSADECPAGRLTVVDKEGEFVEKDYQPQIEILQDGEYGFGAGIYVKGKILIESADGSHYQKRNRLTLCRCGKSRNKPFCDGCHLKYKFKE